MRMDHLIHTSRFNVLRKTV